MILLLINLVINVLIQMQRLCNPLLPKEVRKHVSHGNALNPGLWGKNLNLSGGVVALGSKQKLGKTQGSGS